MNSTLATLVEQLCSFNCDAESGCTCQAHRLYRSGLPRDEMLLKVSKLMADRGYQFIGHGDGSESVLRPDGSIAIRAERR